MLKYTVLFLFAFCAAANAQSKYGSWQQEPDKVDTMAKELRKLVDEATRARAADPRFLQDLRDLADRYVNPWPLLSVQDDFQDGDIQSNPRWVIVSGQFELPYGGGLRSLAIPQAAAPQQQRRATRPEDLAAALLGQILKNGQNSQQQQQTPPPAQTTAAEIQLPSPFPNAFSIQATIRAESIANNVTLAVYQNSSNSHGYRLVHNPVNGLALERHGSRGVVALAAVNTGLRERTEHQLVWTRSKTGDMTVTLDNQEIIRVNDHLFKRGWDGLAFRNDGGDVTLRGIKIYGAQ